MPNRRRAAATSERLKVKEEFLAWRNPGRLSFCNVGRDYGDLSLLITCCNRYCRANCFPAVWPVGIYGIELKKWLYGFLNYAVPIKKCRLPSVLTTAQHPELIFFFFFFS